MLLAESDFPVNFPGSTPNGTIQRRPKSRSASVTRPRPKSVHIGSLHSQADSSLPYASVNSSVSSNDPSRRLSMVGDLACLNEVGIQVGIGEAAYGANGQTGQWDIGATAL